MKSFGKFGLVATLAFLVGAVWQAHFAEKKEPLHSPPSSSSLEIPSSQKAPKEAIAADSTSAPEPSLSGPESRAIEHYRRVIQLGVAERLTQQRIRAKALKQRAALAASARKAQELAQIEETKHRIEREKVQRQLILATAKAQEAQADLAHERAQQAALETQWLIKEKQRRREEIAFQRTQEDYLRKEKKRQQHPSPHSEHQLISTTQRRKEQGLRTKDKPRKEGDNHQTEHRNKDHSPTRSNHSPKPTRPAPLRPAPARAVQLGQSKSASQNHKGTFQKQAQRQKERIRNAWKK